MDIERRVVSASGEVTGATLGRGILRFLKGRVAGFNYHFIDPQYLQEQSTMPYILTPNHVKPERVFAQFLALSVDGLIMEEAVKKLTNMNPAILMKCDDGWWGKADWYRYFQEKISQPFGQGFVKGLGFIPVKRNPGSFNRETSQMIEDVIKRGRPLLVYPEGPWPETPADSLTKLFPGAVNLAFHHRLPIVPAYLGQGGQTWQKGQSVEIIFGEPILVDRNRKNLDKSLERLQTSLRNLRDKYNQLPNKPLAYSQYSG